MAVLTEQELREKIKKSPSGAYFIYGAESYLKKTYVEKLVAKAADEAFRDFNLHTYDGKDAVLGDIYDSVEAFPMMSETSCVLVTDMPLDSLDDGSVELLGNMLDDMPDYCTLIFYLQTVNPTGEKWKKIINLFTKSANVVKLEKKEKNELIRMAERGAEKRLAPFAPGAAAYLIENVGTDLNTVINETDKLCAYAAGRTVTKADIDEVSVKSLEAKAFEIIRALHAGNFDRAMEKLGAVLAQHEEPIMLLGAFVSSYMDMYRVRAAVTSGKRTEDVASIFKYGNNTFRLNNAVRDSKGLSLPAIYECIEILADADDRLKSTSADGGLILEQTLTRLALAEGEGR